MIKFITGSVVVFFAGALAASFKMNPLTFGLLGGLIVVGYELIKVGFDDLTNNK